MPIPPDPIDAVTILAEELGLSTTVGPGGPAVLGLDGIPLRPLAVGWATVELDRAAEELHEWGPYGAARPDRLLGATARVSNPGPSRGSGSGPIVVLLEPSTEGRISELLARRGEGWAALYVVLQVESSVGSGSGTAAAALDGLDRLGRPVRRGSGPFGAALLVSPTGSPSTGAAVIVHRPPALVVVLPDPDPRAGSGSRGSDLEGVPSAP